MVWAQRRKITYMMGLLTFLLVVAFAVFRNATNVAPTCFDNKKNGGESGIDCGGSCLQYCPNELSDPKVRWSRSFEISPGIVHSVAYIEHSYPASSARFARYVFKLYDEKNSLIVEKEGLTYIGPMGRSAIVENLIQTGNSKVALTRFAFLPPIPWEKSDPAFSQVVIKTDRNILEAFDGGLRLTATLENKSRFSFENIDVVAILYDENDNAITMSKILLPNISGLSNQTVYFTWPEKIDLKRVRTIEIIPRINPFKSSEI
jgi:hypothetical protein